MWVKTQDDSYLNLNNGSSLIVKEARNRREWRVQSQGADGVSILYAVQGGYRTQEEAQEALDGLMDSMDETILTIALPEPEEETEDTEDDEEED